MLTWPLRVIRKTVEDLGHTNTWSGFWGCGHTLCTLGSDPEAVWGGLTTRRDSQDLASQTRTVPSLLAEITWADWGKLRRDGLLVRVRQAAECGWCRWAGLALYGVPGGSTTRRELQDQASQTRTVPSLLAMITCRA